jgi:hypothetical protein
MSLITSTSRGRIVFVMTTTTMKTMMMVMMMMMMIYVGKYLENNCTTFIYFILLRVFTSVYQHNTIKSKNSEVLFA